MKMRVQLILNDGTVIEGEDYCCTYRIHDALIYGGRQEYDPSYTLSGGLRMEERNRERPLVNVEATITIRDINKVKAVMQDVEKDQIERRK
jgi:hypothetical protein